MFIFEIFLYYFNSALKKFLSREKSKILKKFFFLIIFHIIIVGGNNFRARAKLHFRLLYTFFGLFFVFFNNKLWEICTKILHVFWTFFLTFLIINYGKSARKSCTFFGLFFDFFSNKLWGICTKILHVFLDFFLTFLVINLFKLPHEN